MQTDGNTSRRCLHNAGNAVVADAAADTAPRTSRSEAAHLEISHVSTLQHTAIHCDKLQHTATYCNTLQYTATYWNTSACSFRSRALRIIALQHTLQHSANAL